MPFSTTNSASMAHSASGPSISTNFKKVFSTLVSKLPHHQKVTPVHIQSSSKTPARPTARSKDDAINKDLRRYYSNGQPATTNSSRKRQLDELVVIGPTSGNHQRKSLERETRHKTVKQYQQSSERLKKKSSYYHWKEYSTASFIDANKAAQPPTAFKTHGYIRDARSNPNHLRVYAITNNVSNKAIINKEKFFIQKRDDEFVWGSQSKLRNVCTITN